MIKFKSPLVWGFLQVDTPESCRRYLQCVFEIYKACNGLEPSASLAEVQEAIHCLISSPARIWGLTRTTASLLSLATQDLASCKELAQFYTATMSTYLRPETTPSQVNSFSGVSVILQDLCCQLKKAFFQLETETETAQTRSESALNSPHPSAHAKLETLWQFSYSLGIELASSTPLIPAQPIMTTSLRANSEQTPHSVSTETFVSLLGVISLVAGSRHFHAGADQALLLLDSLPSLLSTPQASAAPVSQSGKFSRFHPLIMQVCVFNLISLLDCEIHTLHARVPLFSC
jgi:hypothetical protein